MLRKYTNPYACLEVRTEMIGKQLFGDEQIERTILDKTTTTSITEKPYPTIWGS